MVARFQTSTRSRRAVRGFTIIEVLIALAIISLILLIVFVAVPAAQRTARNNQRHRDSAMLLAAVREQQGLAYNILPASCNNTRPNCFVRTVQIGMYDNQSLTDNNVSYFNRTDPDDESSPQIIADNFQQIKIRTYAKCDGGTLTGNGAIQQNIAIQYVIETANGGILICKEA